jgi:hypothetical protein
MNTHTGKVISNERFQKLTEEQKRDWKQFDKGEIVEIKGIRFRVHDLGQSRLVLKFAGK